MPNMNEKLIVNNRTVGFEFEGYVIGISRSQLDNRVPHADVGYDGSLGSNVRNSNSVEVKTYPLNNLNHLDEVFSVLHDSQWFINDYAGTHIHVDISDFSVRQRVKLLRFMKAIEYLMFAINKEYRYYGSNGTENGYCTKLHKDWRKVFRSSFIEQPVNYRQFETLQQYINHVQRNTGSHSNIWNGRYQWANAMTPYNTIEFRIFEPIADVEMAKKFGMLAYHIVETVKHSTLKQLMFMKKTIYNQTSVNEMLVALYEAVGLDHDFYCDIHNSRLAQEIDEKFCKPVREGQTEEVAV